MGWNKIGREGEGGVGRVDASKSLLDSQSNFDLISSILRTIGERILISFIYHITI